MMSHEHRRYDRTLQKVSTILFQFYSGRIPRNHAVSQFGAELDNMTMALNKAFFDAMQTQIVKDAATPAPE